MPTEREKQEAAETLRILRTLYPNADCALVHANAWQLLCATILSAQCTDVRVNQVTPALFAAYPGPEQMADASPADVEALIQSTGFFRQKAKSLISMSQDIVDKFGGEVPAELEDLVTLQGVGRKTANVVIGVAFGGQGLVVDTHVKRIARRLGWTRQTDPVKIEQELCELHPRSVWTVLGHTLILHGRTICFARAPHCDECAVLSRCPEGRSRISGSAS